MAKKINEHMQDDRRTDSVREDAEDQLRQATSRSSVPVDKKHKPRGALFHGDDPTLAKRVEEELNTFGR